MARPNLDEIDREIIDRLSVDARLSNRAIASALGVTEGTIRARLKRLREARMIRFTALTNLSRIGSMRIAFIRVRAEIARIREVAEAIAELEAIKCVIITTGTHGVLAMGPVADLQRELETLVGRIGSMPGVLGLETSITLEAVKYNVRIAKILAPQSDALEEEELEEEI